LQTLKRLGEFRLARLCLVALLALTLDDLLGRALEEVGIAELLIDAGDVGIAFGHFFREPRTLSGKVDDASQFETHSLTPDHELDSARLWHWCPSHV